MHVIDGFNAYNYKYFSLFFCIADTLPPAADDGESHHSQSQAGCCILLLCPLFRLHLCGVTGEGYVFTIQVFH